MGYATETTLVGMAPGDGISSTTGREGATSGTEGATSTGSTATVSQVLLLLFLLPQLEYSY